MSFPTSRTAAVETLLPPPRKGKRKHAAPHQELDRAWPPMPIEHDAAAERRMAHFKALEARIQRAATHVQHQLLPDSLPWLDGEDAEEESSDGAASTTGLVHVDHAIRAILVPHVGVLEQVVKCRLKDGVAVRISSPPPPSTAPGSAGAARATLLASVGSQLLACFPPQDDAGDEEASKALAAGDVSVFPDVISSRGYKEGGVPIVLICPALDQTVADVVLTLQEAMAAPLARNTVEGLILLAVCPTTERWAASPLELRTRITDVHWLRYATAQQELDLFLTFLLGLQQPDMTYPLQRDIEQPNGKKSRPNGSGRTLLGTRSMLKQEGVSVPLSHSAVQLVQALAQLAPPGQALSRAVAALVLVFQYHYTTEPLTAILPARGGVKVAEDAAAMWRPDAYPTALARCIVAQMTLAPDEAAPRVLRDIHQERRNQLAGLGKTICPDLKGESGAADSALAHARWGLLRYLVDTSAVVHPSLEHRASSAGLLADFLQWLQSHEGREAQSDALERNSALPILIASLSPSWRSLEPFVLKAKNGFLTLPPSRALEALTFIRERAQLMLVQLEGETLSQLRSSTGTLPLAHTLESTAKGEGIDGLIRSLEPYVGLSDGPLDGDLAVQQERALSRAAHWVADFFFNQLPVLSSCVPLADAWFPSAAAVASARRHILPSPRTDVQLALEVPELVLASSLDRVASAPDADGELVECLRTFLTQAASERIQPDMAVAYQLMSEQPRLASLADWWSVFAQRVPAPKPGGVWTDTAPVAWENNTTPSSSPLSEPDEDIHWQAETQDSEAVEQAVQARFAAALTALHDMGLLAPGARRAEHVARTVFDVPLVQER